MIDKTKSFSHFPFSNALGTTAKPDALLNCLVFIPVLIVPFSPFIAFFIGLLLLIVFGSGFQQWHRIFVAVVVIFAGAVLNGDGIPHSDYANYYGTYERLLAGHINALFEYGNGVEIGLPAMLWLFGKIFGPLSPAHYMAIISFTSGLLLYIWLETYGLKQVAQKQKAICAALVLMCFDFWFSSWLERQVLSSIIMLYAITAQKQESRFFFILLATLFHATALIFLAIIWLLVRFPKLGIGLCIAICGSYVIFYEIVMALAQTPQTLLFDSIRTKLFFYTNGGADEGGLSARNLVLSVLLLVCTWIYIDKSQAKWRHIILGLGIIYLASTFVSNHLSLRVGVLFYYVCLGYFMFLALRKQPLLLYGFSLLYLLNLCVGMITKAPDNPTQIFHNYDIVGSFFYYLY